MFSQPWPEAGRKRGREEDEAAAVSGNGTLGFTEHRNKRLHSLPLRTSPVSKRWSVPPCFPPTSFPNTITPADSDSEDVQNLPVSRFSPWSSSPVRAEYPSTSQVMETDRDMDMMVDGNAPEQMQPGSSLPDRIVSDTTGRIPTPMNPSFAAQIRGNSWNETSQAVQSIPGYHGGVAGLSPPQAYGSEEDPSVPRTLGSAPSWTMVHNRRLPSPISESGGEDVPASPGMVLDACSPRMAHLTLNRPPLPHLPHSVNPAMAGIGEHPNLQIYPGDADSGMMDTDTPQGSQCQEEHSPSSAPASPSPRARFGHCRSKHTVNSWTLQPGMKKSFSIGYRADCEKCRLKVPGHFNHIIVS